jgi:glycosyltransferase involved in cell wall biosynthesis
MFTDVSNLRTDLEIEFVDKDPVVGVLMPCYNHAKYIEEAINTVLEQDYKNKLLIIIDDKSTDNSLEVVSSLFTKRFQRILDDNNECITVGKIQDVYAILIARNENKKQAAARNKGILTTWNYCDYYCQLDADDWYLPGKLSKSMEVATSDPDNIGLVYSDVIIHNEINDITVHEFREPFDGRRLEQEDIVSNAPIINKRALAEVGLYDESMPPCEDWDLFLRICEKYLAIHIPEPLQKYRVTEQSCTFTVDKEVWQRQWQKIHQKIKRRYA